MKLDMRMHMIIYDTMTHNDQSNQKCFFSLSIDICVTKGRRRKALFKI